MSDDSVRAQYEAYPYPARDPGDEATRLIIGSPSHLLELNHFVFAGRRDFRQPFRALIAGGGTGDGAIMLAQQLADTGGPGQVIYTDVSGASMAVAEARAEARGLANISFHRLSLLDLPGADLGPFDYIDCCGVLHHLADPGAGAAVLAGQLAPDGGLGVMLYGTLGRTGVYPFQDLMRALAPDEPLAARIILARRLLGELPETNWFKRNPLLSDHLKDDAGLVDLLLHERDRAYTVTEIAGLAAGAGLRIAGFVEPARYDPAVYVTEPEIARRLAALPWIARCAAAEGLAGNMRTHVFYAVRADNPGPSVASPTRTGLVPCPWGLDGAAFGRRHRPGEAMTATQDGYRFRLPLPPLAGAMIALMDGRRTIAQIHQAMARQDKSFDWIAFDRQWQALYKVLHGLGKLYLAAFPPSGGGKGPQGLLGDGQMN